MSVPSDPLVTVKLVPSSFSAADVVDAWSAHFLASANWTRVNNTANVGFTIEQAAGATFRINFRVNGADVDMLVDPALTITDAGALTGVSANASPEVTFQVSIGGVDSFVMQEWVDFIRILQRTNTVAPPFYAECLDAGLGCYGLGGDDVANDFDGLVAATGEVSPGFSAANALWTNQVTSKSYIRTATSMWEKARIIDNTIPSLFTDPDNMKVGGRIEPYPAMLGLYTDNGVSNRIVAVHKYLFGYTAISRMSGDIFDDAANSKQMMIIGDTANQSFRWMTPIVDGFDPTA